MSDHIKKLAEQAGMAWETQSWCWLATPPHLEKFAELVRADEREACARLCDEWFASTAGRAIRERGEPLAQPEQEPVAWIGNADFVKGQFVEGRVRRVWWECNTGVGQPLYTSPTKRKWVGLTSEDWENTPDTGKQGCERDAELFDWIEQTLKDKNT